MNIKIKYFLIYISLFVLSLNSLAQEFNKADSLYNNRQYLESSIEYARIGFYSNDPLVIQDVFYRRALCYRFMDESDRAIDLLKRINLSNVRSDRRAKIIYECVLNAYLLKDYNQVLLLINKFKFYEKNVEKRVAIIPIYILSLNSLRKWSQAQNIFENYINILKIDGDIKKSALNLVHSIYEDSNLPKKYSADKASNWSRFIPGAGHMYSGHVAEGFLALGLCTSFAFLGAYEIYYQYYFTGYIFGFGFLQKTYMGGIRRAAYLAKRKNSLTMNLFNSKCVELLIELNT